MLRRGLLLECVPFVLTLAACAHPAPVPVVALPPPPPAPEPPPPPPAPPPPARAAIDPATDPERLAIASAICPAGIKHRDGKVLVGCRACPPFDQSGPDGEVAVDPEDLYPIEAVYHGAFSAPGRDERAVVFTGCEPHAGNYGGTLIADAGPPGYRAVAYFSGVHPETCVSVRRADGRDLLACRWSDAHTTSFDQVFAFDFAAAAPDAVEKGWTELVTVGDSTAMACLGLDPSSGVTHGRILDLRLQESVRGVPQGIVVEIERRWTPWSKALQARVDAACAAASKEPGDVPRLDVAKVFGAPRKETLRIPFDGKAFRRRRP